MHHPGKGPNPSKLVDILAQGLLVNVIRIISDTATASPKSYQVADRRAWARPVSLIDFIWFMVQNRMVDTD
jgi:hypothetical protein